MIRSSTRSHIWLSILTFLQLFRSPRIPLLTNVNQLSLLVRIFVRRFSWEWNITLRASSPLWGIERFSKDLEMKTREQNRNNKGTEIERFDWFIERMQTRVAFGWLNKRTLGWKTFIPENFLEINRYFALTSYCNTIGQSNYAFSILGFLWRENEEAMFWSFHPLADKTNNEHLPRSRSYENHSIVKSTCASDTKEETRERSSPLACAARFTRPLMDSLFAGWRNI